MALSTYTSSSLGFDNFYSSTLSGAISASDTVIPVNTAPTASQGFLVIDQDGTPEVIFYTSKGASSVTCPSVADGRGQGGTTATSHASGLGIKSNVVAEMFKALQDGTASAGLQTYFDQGFYDYVASGLVWTGDALASTRAASMTSGTVYINGRKLAVAAVTSRTFTASKDTYVDILASSTDNTGTVVYTETTNNAASAALAANSIRIGIIVTGATTIAAAGSINQGDPACVLPIASSIPYTVTDSLGNLICNRSANPVLIGYKQAIADQSGITAQVDLTGLSMPIIAPGNRRIELTVTGGFLTGAASPDVIFYLMEGATQLNFNQFQTSPTASHATGNSCSIIIYPTAGLHTYKVQAAAASSATLKATATSPVPFSARLV